MYNDKWQKLRGLVKNARSLPYNPKLLDRARALRLNMTQAERKLWYEFLKGSPVKFLRQRPIDHFIADFYCHEASLIIEVDGGGHFSEEGIMYDHERSAVLSSYGLKVLRFTNIEVMQNFEGVCQEITKQLNRLP